MRKKRKAPTKRTVLRLRQLRRAREMTQAALGRRVGLKTSMISQIESGRRRPSLDKAGVIAAEFGVSIEEIFEQVEIAS
jgi:transcriptional regulator with XRE-family HTH domain